MPVVDRRGESREKVFDFIVRYQRENGYSPSIREICTGVDLASTSTVHYHLAQLAAEGRITHSEWKNRTIKILAPVCCPSCGHDLRAAQA